MNRLSFVTVLLFAVCFIMFATQARANSTTYGSSFISYDSSSDTITATGTTEPDYLADDYYESRVSCWLSDSNGNYLAYGAYTDTWDAGYASVTLSYTGTTPGTQYKLRSLHGFIMGVTDANYGCECYFDDYYNYGFYQNDGIDTEDGFNFLGNGPLFVRHVGAMSLGYTNDSTTIGPQITSISPNRGGVGAMVGVAIFGSGFNGNSTPSISISGYGVTASDISLISSGEITANFNITSDASGGNHAVTVTDYGLTSNSLNFFVQVPTSLQVLSITTIPSNPIYSWSQCFVGQDFGIQVAIQYQVLDQENPAQPILNSIMKPEETFTNIIFQGTSRPDVPLHNLGDSGYPGSTLLTDSNGRFLDAPVGSCSNGTMGLSITQNIRILVSPTPYDIRVNNYSINSSASGSGTISNGGDISATRP